MPLYEYRCLKCEHVGEVLQKLSDRPLRKCDLCSGKLEKLISRTSFQLKGGGWFAHGYGSSGKDSANNTHDRDYVRHSGPPRKQRSLVYPPRLSA